MNVLINNVLTEIVIAPFESNLGYILFAIIKDRGKEADALHIEIAKQIRTVYGAVMDNSNYMENEKEAEIVLSVGHKETDEPQVRLLGCETLRFIDMLRMLGFSVIEKVILKKDTE